MWSMCYKMNIGSNGNLVGNIVYAVIVTIHTSVLRVTEYRCLIVLLVLGTCPTGNQYLATWPSVHYLVEPVAKREQSRLSREEKGSRECFRK